MRNRPNTLPINDVVLRAVDLETKKRRTSPNPVDVNLCRANVLTAAASGHVELKRLCTLTVLQEVLGEKQADVVTLQETRITSDATVSLSARRYAALAAAAGPNGIDCCIIWLRCAPRFKIDWCLDMKAAAGLHVEPTEFWLSVRLHFSFSTVAVRHWIDVAR